MLLGVPHNQGKLGKVLRLYLAIFVCSAREQGSPGPLDRASYPVLLLGLAPALRFDLAASFFLP